MTEQTNNKPRPLEIQFGDSAKYFAKQFCETTNAKDPIEKAKAAEAAESLKFLFKQVPTLNGKQTFMIDLKTFIKEHLSLTSIDDQQTILDKSNSLLEGLITEMKEDTSDLTRKCGMKTNEKVQQVIQ